MKDFEIENLVLEKYNGTDSVVTIPSGVTKIGWGAFIDCKTLVSVNIPNSVTEICDFAFKHCESLVSVSIPNSVVKIGDDAFKQCLSIESVEMPGGIMEIGFEAFCGCSSLSEIRYCGTKKQWEAVEKGSFWNDFIPAKLVNCSDGTVELPQFIINDNVLKYYYFGN